MKQCKECFIEEGTTLINDLFSSKVSVTSNNFKITKIELNENDICNYCEIYNKNYNYEYIKDELFNFIKILDKNNLNKPNFIVALSGGKDSLTALYLAVKLLKLNVIAVTYDNGFIPQNIIEQSKDICEKLGVEYIVKRKELFNEFKNEYKKNNAGVWQAQTGIDFCQVCSKYINKVIEEIGIERNIFKVILGNKIYTSLEPYVSSMRIYKTPNNNIFEYMNLLFALKVDENTQNDILNELKWEDPKLEGYTSNCLIPSFVEFAKKSKNFSGSHEGYIETELRSGAYTKEEAINLLSKKDYKDYSKELDKFFK
jgi:predicted PP-loop superfamily ATPase